MQSLYIFTQEPWFTLSPEVANLLTHYQGGSIGFTIKPFKGFPNKLLVAARFPRQGNIEPLFRMAHSVQAIHIGTEAALYSAR